MVRAEVVTVVSENIPSKLIEGNLNFRQLSKSDNTFHSAVKQIEGYADVILFEILLPSGGLLTPITDRVCYSSETQTAFIEANRPVVQSNKETLCKLMDFAAEKDCQTVFACVDRNNQQFKNIMASYLTIGYSVVPDRSIAMPGYVLLAIEL